MNRRDATPAHTIELLWGLGEPPSRGPKPSLRLDLIVARAVGLADAEGLGAVSMRRLAQELDVTTMSLYRYVPNKEALFELMRDVAGGPPPPPPDPSVSWRPALEQWARALRARYLERPWVLNLPIEGPPLGPNSLAWMEVAMRTLGTLPLTPEQQVRVLLMLTVYVAGEARLATGFAEAAARTGISMAEREAAFATLLSAIAADDRHPALARLVGDGVFGTPPDAADAPRDVDLDGDFEFALARMLDGVEALLPPRA